MNDLDQKLRDYYRDRRLGTDSIKAIDDSARRAHRMRRAYRVAVLAAAASLVIVLGPWLSQEVDPTHRIVAEIALNHQEPGSLLIESSRYSAVQEALSELDFPIRPKREGLPLALGLVGGRYCTVLGSRAAQLQLSHPRTGSMQTLYVVRMTDDMREVKPGTYSDDGVQVEIWSEGELLYGLAGSPRP